MDSAYAYDHIQEESYPQDPPQNKDKDKDGTTPAEPTTFNSEIQDAYKAISNSPWAARLGGLWGNVRKQGEQYYENANKQLPTVTANAQAGLSNLVNRTRSLTVQASEAATAAAATASASKDGAATKEETVPHPDRPESLPADIVKEAEGMLSRFRSEASKRLKDIEKAEDAADEALLKFGTNIRNFLRDAVTIAPPTDGSSEQDPSKVLFESKDSEGKRVIHTTRFDAQLHVIHSSLDSFLKDPASPEWAKWKSTFDVEKKTDAISKDLEKHEELRRAMEKLVPEKVEYKDFWTRYYFLRHVIESEEQRRREMLKASAPDEEEAAWDDDSDEDSSEEESDEDSSEEESDSDDESSTPMKKTNLNASKETLKPEVETPKTVAPPKATATPAAAAAVTAAAPAQPRRSDEKSVADSDASYDLVSGTNSRAPSRAPGSPGQDKKKVVPEEDSSDEEDWE